MQPASEQLVRRVLRAQVRPEIPDRLERLEPLALRALRARRVLRVLKGSLERRAPSALASPAPRGQLELKEQRDLLAPPGSGKQEQQARPAQVLPEQQDRPALAEQQETREALAARALLAQQGR